MRDWKMRLPPRKPLSPDATDAMKADDAFERVSDEDRASESALLAEAIGEISKIVLSFDDEGRHRIAQTLAVLGPEPGLDARDPWLEAAETIKQIAIAYTAAQQERTKQDCPDCAKPKPARVVRAPANVVGELTDEELQHLARKFGAQYVQAAIAEINALRDAGDEPEDEKKA